MTVKGASAWLVAMAVSLGGMAPALATHESGANHEKMDQLRHKLQVDVQQMKLDQQKLSQDRERVRQDRMEMMRLHQEMTRAQMDHQMEMEKKGSTASSSAKSEQDSAPAAGENN